MAAKSFTHTYLLSSFTPSGMINILLYTSWLVFKDKAPQALVPCQETSDLLVVLLGNIQINCSTGATRHVPNKIRAVMKLLWRIVVFLV